MGIIYEEKEEKNLLGGYPVRETFYKEGEVLHFDKRLGKWIAGTVDSMRGVAVFVQTTEPVDPELNDLWIVI